MEEISNLAVSFVADTGRKAFLEDASLLKRQLATHISTELTKFHRMHGLSPRGVHVTILNTRSFAQEPGTPKFVLVDLEFEV